MRVLITALGAMALMLLPATAAQAHHHHHHHHHHRHYYHHHHHHRRHLPGKAPELPHKEDKSDGHGK